MSRENIEALRRLIEYGNASSAEEQIAAMTAIYHPDAEARDLQPAPGTPAVMQGRAAIMEVIEQWFDTLDDWRLEVHEFVDADPWVICDLSWHATGKASGVPIDMRETEAYEFRDGKIVCAIFNLLDVAAALEAVGTPSDQDAHADS